MCTVFDARMSRRLYYECRRGREGGREGAREGGREGGKDRGRKGRREGEREREGTRGVLGVCLGWLRLD
eukprot:87179-Rhodomonas_salina.1